MPGGSISVLRAGLTATCALCAACNSPSVSYKGSVTRGQAQSHSFDATPNPESRPSVHGATVEMFFDGASRCSLEDKMPADRRAQTGSDGSFELPALGFGGPAEDPHAILICVFAEGFAEYEYRATYARTPDPTNAAGYLNVVLQPL